MNLIDNFTLDCLVLTHAEQRVEMHIRCDDDGLCTLYAFSGEASHFPGRHLQQGPFQRREEAVGSRRAVALSLIETGFHIAESQAPLWLIPLQREVNSARRQRQESRVDYRFDPKDVYLDW